MLDEMGLIAMGLALNRARTGLGGADLDRGDRRGYLFAGRGRVRDHFVIYSTSWVSTRVGGMSSDSLIAPRHWLNPTSVLVGLGGLFIVAAGALADIPNGYGYTLVVVGAIAAALGVFYPQLRELQITELNLAIPGGSGITLSRQSPDTEDAFWAYLEPELTRLALLLTAGTQGHASDLVSEAMGATQARLGRLRADDRESYAVRRMLEVYEHGALRSYLGSAGQPDSEDSGHWAEVSRALSPLPVVGRAAVHFSMVEVRSLSEIARILGCSAEDVGRYTREGRILLSPVTGGT